LSAHDENGPLRHALHGRIGIQEFGCLAEGSTPVSGSRPPRHSSGGRMPRQPRDIVTGGELEEVVPVRFLDQSQPSLRDIFRPVVPVNDGNASPKNRPSAPASPRCSTEPCGVTPKRWFDPKVRAISPGYCRKRRAQKISTLLHLLGLLP